MIKLHGILMGKNRAYFKWLKDKNHSLYYWVFFFVISIFSLTTVLKSVQALAVPYQDPGTNYVANKKVLVPASAQDHILVKFKDNVGQSKKAEVLAKHGLSEKHEIKQLGVKVVNIPDTVTPEEAVQNMKSERDVQFAEPDFIAHPLAIPTDPSYPNQWYLPQISAPNGWDISTGSTAVIIAVIDSGLDPADPEFVGKLAPGWNYISDNSTITPNMPHGTGVAISAAANTNNGIGGAGVSWNSYIMPLVIFDSAGNGSYSDVASAMTFAADNGAKVINMSLGGQVDSMTLQSSINYAWNKGLVLVASAGNYGTNALVYPAANPNIVGVSATCDAADNMASFSSFGSFVDVAAPGCNINGWNGTSFSSPITAGVVSLMFAAKPTLTNSQAVNVLLSNSDDLGPVGWDDHYGFGRVNIARTLAALNQIATDTIAPSIPGNLFGSAPSATQVNLSWTSSTDNVGVVGYKVYRNGTQIASPNSTSYSDTTVTAATSYSYAVAAVDAAGNLSAKSSAVTIVTPSPSISIVSFSVTTKTVNSATIVWTTNVPSTGSVSYGTTRNGLTLSATDGQLSTTHSVTLTGLAKFSNYYYKINATSQGGQSVSSAVSSFKTAKK